MSIRFRSIAVAFVLLAALARPAAAQGGATIAAGVSFWNMEQSTSTGFALDYSRDVRSTGQNALGLVVDFGQGHFDRRNAVSLNAGVRIGGAAGARVRWHGQGLIGMAHSRPTGDVADLCAALESECNHTYALFMPGVGIDVKTANTLGLRAQVDFPIWKVAPGVQRSTRVWLGLSWTVGR